MATNDTVLLEGNDRHRKYTGVDKFHAAGYYGERVTAASGECWDIRQYNPGGKVLDPLGISDGDMGHAVDTAATFFQVAPKAKLAMLYATNGIYRSDSYENKFLSHSAKIVEELGITNMFVSLNTSRHVQYFNDLSKWLKKHNTFKYYWAAGNSSTSDYSKILEIKELFGVAAYTVMVNMDIVPAYYSSETIEVDFAAPSGIYTKPSATKRWEAGFINTGTSFSTPWLCGMACLVDDFFIDKKGKPLTFQGMYQFFKDYCEDLKTPGLDAKTGWGAVRLPDPSEIDIEKYFNIGRIITPDGREVTDVLDKFKDRDKISKWAEDGIRWAVENGYMNGVAPDRFDPRGNVTREQLAVILQRIFSQLEIEEV